MSGLIRQDDSDAKNQRKPREETGNVESGPDMVPATPCDENEAPADRKAIR